MTPEEAEALSKKLELKDRLDAYTLHAPDGYMLPDTKPIASLAEVADEIAWIQVFYESEAELTRELPAIEQKLRADGKLWVCWPKRSAKAGSDLSDSVVRSIGLACGLVDRKVASIDKVYSALLFVYRKADR